MSQCIDHKTTLPDTHGHVRPAIDIPRNIPIACGGIETRKSNIQQLVIGFATDTILKYFHFFIVVRRFQNICLNPTHYTDIYDEPHRNAKTINAYPKQHSQHQVAFQFLTLSKNKNRKVEQMGVQTNHYLLGATDIC